MKACNRCGAKAPEIQGNLYQKNRLQYVKEHREQFNRYAREYYHKHKTKTDSNEK